MSDWFDDYGWARIAEQLSLGAYPTDAADVQVLSEAGITHVVNLCEDCEYGPGARDAVTAALELAGIGEDRVAVVDYGGLLPGQIERAVRFVCDALDAGEHVYLHCRAGWQRSATVACAVIAARDAVAPDVALAAVKTRKPSAEPLHHQLQDLWNWWRLREARAAEA